MLPTRDLTFKDTCKLKVKGQKKIFNANGNQKSMGSYTYDKTEKDSHYIMIKGLIH